jgi:ribokinase
MRENHFSGDTRKLYDVVGVGCHAVDLLCMMDRYPVEDEKIEVDSIEMQGGGNIATALVAVARLGGKAAFQGVVGDDQYRDRVISDLRKEGVDTGCLKVKEGNNALAFIIINKSSSTRTIIYTRKNIPWLYPDDVDPEIIRQGKVLLIDFYYPEASLRASEIARGSGIPVVVDAERRCDLAFQIMKNATHIIASRGFAEWFTGLGMETGHRDVLMKFYDRIKSPFICITLGSEGAVGYEGNSGKIFHQKAFRVDVVDTTGAGDVFHGAFAFFLARGYNLQEALGYSSACAAFKCRSIGGRRGIPSLDEVKSFIRGY